MQKEIKELLDKSCTPIKVHAPTLDENMRPKVQLLNMECPKGKDGSCHTCENFMGFLTEDTEGAISACYSYDGYCLTDETDRTVIKEQLYRLVSSEAITKMLEDAGA